MPTSDSTRRLHGGRAFFPAATLTSQQGRPAGFLAAVAPEYDSPQHQAELFYLKKQIQSQTPMVIVLEDGEQLEGLVEWYDRHAIKLRGRVRTLVYKSAIKYMYKLGDSGQ